MNQTFIFKVFARMSVLHVAEKNSIAKQVANILSSSRKRTAFSLSRFNPIFQFQLNSTPMKFTSVRGHLFDYQLPAQCKLWATYDNKKILSSRVPLVKILGPDMENVVKNLQKLARQNSQLILWLDCDRQGEAIAFEVIEICTKINPRLKIQRARFAAVTPTDIWAAYNNLVLPNEKQADAVNFRIQIDFRIGCTFTRYQTVIFGKYYQLINKTVLSYGPCQMPTLSFVVNRFLEIKYFKPEKYWVIEATCIIDENTAIPFNWVKKNTRDQVLANSLIYSMIDKYEDGNVYAKVLSRQMNPKKRYRPYPLTTVTFQKLATDKLKMSSAQAMQIAEKLYQRGLISYPRTQTNSFPKTMNLKSLVSRLEGSEAYGSYINKLLNQDKYMNPKVGNKDDQAHTPIHPVKLVQLNQLTPDQRKIYDLISRHFLACCSKDAIGEQYQVRADIGDQEFKASYLTIKEKNYLQIYPYDKWTESSFPAQIPEQFPAMLNLKENQTKPPNYITQSELISMMEENQIGTDSTIHEHIETIQKRQYAIKTNNTFKPTILGASMIQAYRKLKVQLPQCQIRRKIEQSMNKIAEGQIEKQLATQQTLLEMEPLYDRLQLQRQQWIKAFGECMQEYAELKDIGIRTKDERQQQSYHNQKKQVQVCKCPICKSPGLVRYSQKTQKYFIGCSRYPDCKWLQSLPGYIAQIEPLDELCTKCGEKIAKIRVKQNARIDQLMMRVRFSETEDNTLELCIAPGCDSYFYQNIEPTNYSRTNQTATTTNAQNRSYQQTNRSYTNTYTNTYANTGSVNSNNTKKEIICFKCKQVGHFATNCPKQVPQSRQGARKQMNTSSNFINNNIKCFKCHEPGHIAPNCPNKSNYQKKNVSKEPQQDKQKKVCPECGAQGRHPKFSTCSRVKRNKTSKPKDE